MAGVGELLVYAVVKAAAGKLAAAVGQQVSLWRNHKRDLDAMKDDLDLVQAVLRAAEKRSFTDDAVRRWLQQLKAVAYNISDTLADGDDSSSSSWKERLKVANKISELKKKLTKVVKRHTILGFNLQIRPANEEVILNKVVKERETVAYIDRKSIIVGRSEDRDEIIGLLLKEEGTTILPIVGMGGMGKTTLAKLIFNDNKMKDFNGSKAWVYVSEKFDLIKIGNDVISELGGANESCNNLQSVFKCLKNKMTDGKFLIVLDDLWEEDVDQLNSLKHMLQPEKSQITMKIIVTTRSEAIALKIKCSQHDTFHIKSLSDDNCWAVFKSSAFPSTEFFTTEEDELEKIGQDIAKKCKGLPLAAHAVGSMLHSKSIDFWKVIRDSDVWNETDEKVLPSLRLSYDHMPSHLKQCFAYCAIFPKGFIRNKDQLIQQWIALGFVQPFPTNLSHNAQAEQQVRDLLEISFLQNSISDSSSSSDIGNIAKAPQELSMHDLVHDLATLVSGDETLTLDATKENKDSNERHRHVVVVNYDEGRLSKSLPVNIRALHFRDCGRTQLPNNAFSSTRYVRVLDISGCAVGRLSNSIPQFARLRYLDASGLQDKELPKWITKLFKLQYFSIHNSYGISKLPKSIGSLKDLVHLDLSGCQDLLELPKSIGNLKKLVHVNLSSCTLFVKLPESIGNLKDLVHLDLSNSYNLVELPESVGNLKNLVHVNLSYCLSLEKLPESIDNLKNLVHLDLSSCRHLVELPESVGNLKNLMHVNLSYCLSLEKLPKSIGNLKNLVYLDLSSCRHLVELPESVGNLQKLVHVNLSDCASFVKLPESIGNLKDLVHLDLSDSYDLVELPESVSNLKNLVHVNLSCCLRLEKLSESIGNLKNLVHLDLSSCKHLVELPESVGNLEKLVHVNLSRCVFVKLPESVDNLEYLVHLDLSWCFSLVELPESIGNLKKLVHVNLSKCVRFIELPESIGNLKDLVHLNLSACESLVGLPESVGNLKDLVHLDLSICRSLVELPESVGNLKDLVHLDLSACRSLVGLPESVGNLKNLVHLNLSQCGSLVGLPESVSNLKNLVHLNLSQCGSLVGLPESVGNLKNLVHLDLSQCGSLG